MTKVNRSNDTSAQFAQECEQWVHMRPTPLHCRYCGVLRQQECAVCGAVRITRKPPTNFLASTAVTAHHIFTVAKHLCLSAPQDPDAFRNDVLKMASNLLRKAAQGVSWQKRRAIEHQALYETCQNREKHMPEVLKLLLNAKVVPMANPEVKYPRVKSRRHALSALQISARREHEDCVRLLLQHPHVQTVLPHYINKTDLKGRSALYFACRTGNMRIVRMLLEAKASIIPHASRRRLSLPGSSNQSVPGLSAVLAVCQGRSHPQAANLQCLQLLLQSCVGCIPASPNTDDNLFRSEVTAQSLYPFCYGNVSQMDNTPASSGSKLSVSDGTSCAKLLARKSIARQPWLPHADDMRLYEAQVRLNPRWYGYVLLKYQTTQESDCPPYELHLHATESGLDMCMYDGNGVNEESSLDVLLPRGTTLPPRERLLLSRVLQSEGTADSIFSRVRHLLHMAGVQSSVVDTCDQRGKTALAVLVGKIKGVNVAIERERPVRVVRQRQRRDSFSELCHPHPSQPDVSLSPTTEINDMRGDMGAEMSNSSQEREMLLHMAKMLVRAGASIALPFFEWTGISLSHKQRPKNAAPAKSSASPLWCACDMGDSELVLLLLRETRARLQRLERFVQCASDDEKTVTLIKRSVKVMNVHMCLTCRK